MSDKWYDAVSEGAQVIRLDGRVLGQAIAYCDGPMVLVEDEHGERRWIRASVIAPVLDADAAPASLAAGEAVDSNIAPVQTVECSQCGAEPGAECTGPGQGWHLNRWDLLHDQPDSAALPARTQQPDLSGGAA